MENMQNNQGNNQIKQVILFEDNPHTPEKY